MRRRRDGDIPYGQPSFFKGTQAPVFRLHLTQIGVTVTVATLYNTVYSLSAGQLLNFSDLANMWDEFRFLRGEFELYGASTYTIVTGPLKTGFGVAAVDYSIAAAFSSFDTAQTHDTRKFFNVFGCPGFAQIASRPLATWPVHFEPLPDQDWEPTTTSTTVKCYWKPCIPAAEINASFTSACYLLGWFDIQVRGQAG